MGMLQNKKTKKDFIQIGESVVFFDDSLLLYRYKSSIFWYSEDNKI